MMHNNRIRNYCLGAPRRRYLGFVLPGAEAAADFSVSATRILWMIGSDAWTTESPFWIARSPLPWEVVDIPERWAAYQERAHIHRMPTSRLVIVEAMVRKMGLIPGLADTPVITATTRPRWSVTEYDGGSITLGRSSGSGNGFIGWTST
jgi:hypothetical protein